MNAENNSDSIIKVIGLVLAVIGLIVGGIIGVSRHLGVWSVGTALMGGFVGGLTGIELAGYIRMVKNRRANRSKT